MRSYDGIDSYEFMNSNAHYRVLAYMVQPFFENGEGEMLPDTPTMKFIPLESEWGYSDNCRIRLMNKMRALRKLRKKVRNLGGRGRATYEKRNINNKEAP